MIPRQIELENFLSFGEPAVQFVFTETEPLWILCGRNGAGKSAVFDGITYALYGEHRGGTQKAEQLIRHGAKGFRVVFEFEFAGNVFRITRARSVRTIQKVEQYRSGDWEVVAGISSAADVKVWVEKTLGLGYKAFTTSVLLRQGEADKLFTASRDDRINLLKGIIGFERFEEVSQRIHAATVQRKTALDIVERQRLSLSPVSAEELSAALAAVTVADRQLEEVQLQLQAAVQRVEQSRQWLRLEAKRVELERQCGAADLRAAAATTLRADKFRLEELQVMLPVLKSLLNLQQRIFKLEPLLAEAESARVQTTARLETNLQTLQEARQEVELHRERGADFQRQLQALVENRERTTKLLQIAGKVKMLQTRMATYPENLGEQLAAAEAEEKITLEGLQTALSATAAVEALLQLACQQREQFARVEVGVRCSRCGQQVDEAHAVKEHARLAADIEGHSAEAEARRRAVTGARQTSARAHQQRLHLQKEKTDFERFRAEFTTAQEHLRQIGDIAEASELHARLATQGQEKTRLEACLAAEQSCAAEGRTRLKQCEVERANLEAVLQDLTATVRRHETELITARGQQETRCELLLPDWRRLLEELSPAKLAELDEERQHLESSGVMVQFELLQRDEAKRVEWSKQLEEIQGAIELLPVEARIAPAHALELQERVKTAASLANTARDAAVRLHDDLRARSEEHARLSARRQQLDREYELHRKLDELLGQNGLQRELVRDAEQQIVSLANDTLLKLSDGDLALEQENDVSGKDDRAFDLRVRRDGDAIPIGVMFLSASQKFRVAVSVALAVGRFASGRARPLEAVIIDEGFGSLDKEGLRAMADELKRLQQSQSLKRVVLVSHQEEFTEQFPVGFLLTPGPAGTTVTPFRR